MKTSKPRHVRQGRISKKRQRQRVEHFGRKSILPIIIVTAILAVLVWWGYRAQALAHLGHKHGSPAPTVAK